MNRRRFLWLPLLLALVVVMGISAGLMGSGGSRSVIAGVCPPVSNTPLFTIVYGTVTLNGAAAPVGTVVEARSPRGDVVGCFVVSTAGNYGSMYVYGEDTSVSPPVPGMRNGEVVAFRVNGAAATASPELVWHNDHDLHQVALSATSAPCYDFDHSGQVDANDIQAVASGWRLRAGDTGWDARFDVNGDGVINIVDIMRVSAAWGNTCP
jgi:hypothetical protein